jgi:hypothetical protein
VVREKILLHERFFEKRGVCIRELKRVEFALFVEFEA